MNEWEDEKTWSVGEIELESFSRMELEKQENPENSEIAHHTCPPDNIEARTRESSQDRRVVWTFLRGDGIQWLFLLHV